MPRKKSEIQDVVRCKRFELVDDEGRVLMVARVDGGVTRLKLFDGKGKERLSLAAYPGDPKTYGAGCGELSMRRKGKGIIGIYHPMWRLLG